ncbi:ATP12 family protein [Roseospirillum parvum]|uniref:Chaperone required for the assembly of the F1-ATPase n=1 Tax=Roseospirillum parvum TaxID=83401 RepID=A0A1G7ZA83_9PROT|nr:ATP12 family protein [Roseospirillum parvum]SDH05446.1 Chaperone required for the assembly of the F1-ATPase [Roseospirillum parvum]
MSNTSTTTTGPGDGARAAEPTLKPSAKRAYTTASAGPTEGGHAVMLDRRPLSTPARAALVLPSAALAGALAEEWQAQGPRPAPATMPLTRLAFTAVDRVGPGRDQVEASLLSHVDGDQICYPAERPAALAAAQTAHWQPLRDWAMQALDAPLAVAGGVMPVAQPPAVGQAFGAALKRLDGWRLTAVQEVAGITGSLVLALALAHRHLDVAGVCAAAHLDERHQMADWGEDAEALDRLARAEADIAAAGRFLDLLEEP